MRVSYTFENLYSYTVLDEESEFTFAFPQKSTDNIFKMASLSVKRSIKRRHLHEFLHNENKSITDLFSKWCGWQLCLHLIQTFYKYFLNLRRHKKLELSNVKQIFVLIQETVIEKVRFSCFRSIQITASKKCYIHEPYHRVSKKWMRNTAILNDVFQKNEGQNCKLPLDINKAFS